MTFKEFIKKIDPSFDFTVKVEYVVDSIDRWSKSDIPNLLLNLPRKFGKTTLARYLTLYVSINDRFSHKSTYRYFTALISSNNSTSQKQNKALVDEIKSNKFENFNIQLKQEKDGLYRLDEECIDIVNTNKSILTKPCYSAFCGYPVSFMILDELLYSAEDYQMPREKYEFGYQVIQMRLSNISKQIFFNNLEWGSDLSAMFKELNKDYFEITVS